LQMVLQRLHQSVRLSAGNITMLEQNFDSKPPFSIRAVAEGQQKQTVTRTAAGWNILETGGNGSPSLFTATQGRRFIISNDSGALNQLIQNQKNSLELPSPVTFPLSSLRAGGMISPRMRKRLLADEPSILLSLLLPSWTSNSPLLWARRQVGLVGTISLEAISSAAGSQ
ncbi:MAG: hypothetical protein JWM56_1200, partial [Candidatus Peribacteria bacterium]|nr:hypothetical protein [Candidatus Peribacteria bacterium]